MSQLLSTPASKSQKTLIVGPELATHISSLPVVHVETPTDALQLPPERFSTVLITATGDAFNLADIERLEAHFKSAIVLWTGRMAYGSGPRAANTQRLFEQSIRTDDIGALKSALVSFIRQQIPTAQPLLYITPDAPPTAPERERILFHAAQQVITEMEIDSNGDQRYMIANYDQLDESAVGVLKQQGTPQCIIFPISDRIFVLGFLFVAVKKLTVGIVDDLLLALDVFKTALEEYERSWDNVTHPEWQHALMQNTTEGYLMVNDQQQIAVCNETICRWFGEEASQFTHMDVSVFLDQLAAQTADTNPTAAALHKQLHEFESATLPEVSQEIRLYAHGPVLVKFARFEDSPRWVIKITPVQQASANRTFAQMTREIQAWIVQTRALCDKDTSLDMNYILGTLMQQLDDLEKQVDLYQMLVQDPNPQQRLHSLPALLKAVFSDETNDLKKSLWDFPNLNNDIPTVLDETITRAALGVLLNLVQTMTRHVKPELKLATTGDVVELIISLDQPYYTVRSYILDEALDGKLTHLRHTQIVQIAGTVQSLKRQGTRIETHINDNKFQVTLHFTRVRSERPAIATTPTAPTPKPLERVALLLSEDYTEENVLRPVLRQFGYDLWLYNRPHMAFKAIDEHAIDIVLLSTSIGSVEDVLQLCAEVVVDTDLSVILVEHPNTELAGADWQAAGATEVLTALHGQGIQVRLRHALKLITQPYAHYPPLRVGDAYINPRERAVYFRGVEMELSAIQFDILYTLAQNQGRTVLYESLGELWQDDDDTRHRIHMQMTRIRAVIKKANPGFKIQTIRDKGYSLRTL